MSDAFTGEIRIYSGNFAPTGWAICDGTLLPSAQNTALYNVIGTTFGGDATNFALPDFRDRAPLGAGHGPGLSPRSRGQTGGAAAVTLSTAQLPAHKHTVNATTTLGNALDPNGDVWGVATGARGAKMYASSAGTAPAMNAQAIASAGGGAAHNNLSPYLVLTFIICLSGVTPISD